MNANFRSTAREISVEDSPAIRWSMIALTAFPLIDYALRRFVPPVGSIWDKIVLLILLAIAGFRYLCGERPVSTTWSKFAGYFLMYGLALVLGNFALTLLTIAGYRIDVYYIIFGLLIPFVVGPNDVEKLLYAISSLAILIGLDGVFQYIAKTPIPSSWFDVGEHLRTRVFSVLISCNELGAYMALMIPIIGAFMIYDTDRRRKWLFGLGLVPCVLTVLFTYSRAAWFSLGLSILIMALMFKKRLLIVLVFLLSGLFFIPTIHHRIIDLFSPIYWTESVRGGRVARWQEAFAAVKMNPLFGVGPGHYGGAMAVMYHLSMYADNYYAKTIGETGIVGLTLFLATDTSLIRDLRIRTKRVSGRKKWLFLGGMTGLLSVLIHNGFENVFEYAPMTLTYFLLMALFLVWGQAEMGKGKYTKAEQIQMLHLTTNRWVLFVLWAVCANAINVWLVKPIVNELAIVGILFVMIATGLWLVSLPVPYRKKWVQLTIFDLLFGQSVSYGMDHPHFIAQTICSVIGLLLITWIMTRIRIQWLLISAIFDLVVLLKVPNHVWRLEITASLLLGMWILGGFAIRYRLRECS